MHRHHRSLTDNKIFMKALPAAAGIVCTILCTLIFSALAYFILEDIRFTRLFNTLSLCAGGAAGGYVCGKYSRHNGLAGGALCGLEIYAAMTAASLAVTGDLPETGKLLFLAASGAVGGICGVNSPHPGP